MGSIRVNGREYDLSAHEYLATVETINIGRPGDPQSGTATVLVDDIARKARVQPSGRNAKPGDTVIVEKTGKVYRITAKATYEPPPRVSGSMGPPPANAQTATGSNIPTSPLPPDAPSSPSGNTNNQLYASLVNVTAFLQDFRNGWAWTMRSNLNQTATQVNGLRGVTNTNASRTNAVRDYAGNAGDLVEPVVGVLKNEGLASD